MVRWATWHLKSSRTKATTCVQTCGRWVFLCLNFWVVGKLFKFLDNPPFFPAYFSDCRLKLSWRPPVLLSRLPFSHSDPLKILTATIRGIDQVDFPKTISRSASSLIKKLCRCEYEPLSTVWKLGQIFFFKLLLFSAFSHFFHPQHTKPDRNSASVL